MTRLNITLPDNIAEKLNRKKNKSRFIAIALQDKFEQEEQRALEEEMAEGYKAVAKEDKQVGGDWESAGLETWE
jgi:metal-responsive CopG/Arc/MetJ family transcriptional regulator